MVENGGGSGVPVLSSAWYGQRYAEAVSQFNGALDLGNLGGGDYSNVPIRHEGPYPLVKPGESPEFVLVGDPHIQAFRLWMPDEQAAMQVVLNQVGRREAVLRYDISQYVPAHENWSILLSWINLYREVPKHASEAPVIDRSNENAAAQQSSPTVEVFGA